jgi:hypothetical protein
MSSSGDMARRTGLNLHEVLRRPVELTSYKSRVLSASALETSERNVRFGHLVVESPRYHES